uniref:Uncharacterized protein n=1 Tax=Anguilla anguilla TaxID=7936 RepID=A0A0E9TFS5_ANGAN
MKTAFLCDNTLTAERQIPATETEWRNWFYSVLLIKNRDYIQEPYGPAKWDEARIYTNEIHFCCFYCNKNDRLFKLAILNYYY